MFSGVPFFKFVIPNIAGVGPYFAAIAELGPSFLSAMLAAYVVSKIWPDPELEKVVELELKNE